MPRNCALQCPVTLVLRHAPGASLQFTAGQRVAGPSFQLRDEAEPLVSMCQPLCQALDVSRILDMARMGLIMGHSVHDLSG